MLTKRQKQVLDYIKKFIEKNDFAPSLEEIKKHLKLSSVSTAHHHVKTLENLGYLQKEVNKPRAIDIFGGDSIVKIPLLGKIAAGQPIEAVQEQETIAISKNRISKLSDVYALRVVGNSMIDENINDGDVVIIKNQNTAENGQKIIALINNNEATLKKFYKEKDQIRLQPANKDIQPILLNNKQDFLIQGIVLDVIRKESPFLSDVAEENTATKKYSQLPLNSIICGDAIEEMKKIPSESIDMTFADPPFNLNKKYGNYKDKKLDI